MNHRFLAIAGAFALCAGPAYADLTAEEVLADHLNLLSGYGLIEVTSTGTIETATGLSVDGLVATYADDETQIEIRYGGFTLEELGPDRVRITYPASYPITIDANPAGEPPVEVTVMLETVALNHEASGSSDNLQHMISFERAALGNVQISPLEQAENLNLNLVFELENGAASLSLNSTGTPRRDVTFDLGLINIVAQLTASTDIGLENSETSYKATGPGDVDLVFNLTNLAGNASYEALEIPHHSLNLSLGSLNWTQTAELPDEEGNLALSVSTTDMTVDYDLALSIETMEQSAVDALTEGQSARADFGFASLGYSFGIDTPEGAVVGKSSNGRTEGRFSFDKDGFAYSGSSRDTLAEIGVPIPDFPLSSFGYALDAGTFDMFMPILPLDEPQPFRLKFSFEGMRTDEEVWSLIDPGQALPRDPINMAIDLEGTTHVTADLFNGSDDVPFRQTKARLNALRLSVAGAELTGDGSIVDTSTGDIPGGNGELNLKLTGGNTLLDTLVAMGLLPDEQAMGARMMLGLIARPGDGPDTLVSKIEVKEDGSILANGQRIK